MKTTKVYHSPGYPLDPKKEQQRAFDNLSSDYSCVMIPKKPILLKSETHAITFNTQEEADAFIARMIHYRA